MKSEAVENVTGTGGESPRGVLSSGIYVRSGCCALFVRSDEAPPPVCMHGMPYAPLPTKLAAVDTSAEAVDIWRNGGTEYGMYVIPSDCQTDPQTDFVCISDYRALLSERDRLQTEAVANAMFRGLCRRLIARIAEADAPNCAEPTDLDLKLHCIILDRDRLQRELDAARANERRAFELGWRTAANWMERDDLHADIGSPCYIADREAALAAQEGK